MKTIQKIGKRLVKNTQAVSPIIATLMLVLVAVGSAGAFYVWQSGWQSDMQGKAGGADIKSSLSIAGSTTVYPFTAVAVELYESANPNMKIDYQAGGSGAGVHSVGIGTVDIGSASRNVKDEEKAKYPDLNRDGTKDLTGELVEHLIGYDAVAIVVSTSNNHGLVNITEATVRDIYYTNGGVTGHTSILDNSGNGKVEWNEVPKDITVVTFRTEPTLWSVVGTIPVDGDAPTANWRVAANGGEYYMFIDADLNNQYTASEVVITTELDGNAPVAVPTALDAAIANVKFADGTTDYWFIDADLNNQYTASEVVITTGATGVVGNTAYQNLKLKGSAGTGYAWNDIYPTNSIYDVRQASEFCTGLATEVVTIYDRQEESGTEETFATSMTGSGGKNTLEEMGITCVHKSGNEALLLAISGDKHALGFMSYGFAKATTSGVNMIPFAGDKVTALVDPKVKATFEDNIRSLGINYYDGSRNLYYVTVGQPQGTAKSYLDFVFQPRTNMDICNLAGYIALYK